MMNEDDLFREIELLRDHNRRMMINVRQRDRDNSSSSRSSSSASASSSVVMATPSVTPVLHFNYDAAEPMTSDESDEIEERTRPRSVTEAQQSDSEVSSLMSMVHKLLKSYRFLMSSPQLFICDHYDAMINEIDLETEMLLIAETSRTGQPSSSDAEKELDGSNRSSNKSSMDRVANLNKIRECMINLIKKHEKDCLLHCAKVLNGESENLVDWNRGHEELIKLEAEFDILSHRQLTTMDKSSMRILKSDLVAFNVLLHESFHAIKKVMFLNKSIFYVKNLNELETKLLTFDEQVEADVFGRDKSFYTSKKKLDEAPIEMGNLITIENLFLSDVEIELVK